MPDEPRVCGIKTTIRSVPPDQDGTNPPAARAGLVIGRWERETEGPMFHTKKPITPEDPAMRAGWPLPGAVVKAQPRWLEGQMTEADASAPNMLTDQTWSFFQQEPHDGRSSTRHSLSD